MKESGFPGRLERDGEDFMMMLEQIDGPGRYFHVCLVELATERVLSQDQVVSP